MKRTGLSRILVVALVAVVLGAGGFVAYQQTTAQRDTGMEQGVDSETDLVPVETNQLEGVPTGDAQPLVDERTGAAPEPFVIEFMKKLNEVNLYIGTNEFDNALQIDALYVELWRWAEANGLRLRAVLSQGAIDAGNTEFQPQPTAFLEIQTEAGVDYCAADVRLFNPEGITDDVMRQALMGGSCQDYFEQVRPDATETNE
jgi:hypothetical protein